MRISHEKQWEVERKDKASAQLKKGTVDVHARCYMNCP